MNKSALTLHLALFKVTFVLVAFGPFVCAETIHFVVFEVALISRSIRVNCKPCTMLFVIDPFALVLC